MIAPPARAYVPVEAHAPASPAPAPEPVPCPECGAPMVLRAAGRTYKDGTPRRFYGCPRWPACTGTHGAHRDGRPMGIPADGPTKALRIRAHAALDRLWKGGRQRQRMTRADAYALLRRLLFLSEENGHVSRLDADQCRLLLDLLAAWEAFNPNPREVAT